MPLVWEVSITVARLPSLHLVKKKKKRWSNPCKIVAFSQTSAQIFLQFTWWPPCGVSPQGPTRTRPAAARTCSVVSGRAVALASDLPPNPPSPPSHTKSPKKNPHLPTPPTLFFALYPGNNTGCRVSMSAWHVSGWWNFSNCLSSPFQSHSVDRPLLGKRRRWWKMSKVLLPFFSKFKSTGKRILWKPSTSSTEACLLVHYFWVTSVQELHV